jgi:hypothetical protein
MAHANPSKPYGARDEQEIALKCDVALNTVRAVLRGEPLKSRARQRVYRQLVADGCEIWIAKETA